MAENVLITRIYHSRGGRVEASNSWPQPGDIVIFYPPFLGGYRRCLRFRVRVLGGRVEWNWVAGDIFPCRDLTFRCAIPRRLIGTLMPPVSRLGTG